MDHNQPIEVDQNVECDVCGGVATEIPPCGHAWCSDCLNQMIRHACQDGERWPPRCCIWHVNLDSRNGMLLRLDPEVTRLVLHSKTYYSTRDKLFCCQRDCRKFIAPSDVNESTNIGFCRACWGGTCSLCRRHPHIGPCKRDLNHEAMKGYLLYKGWKRCEQCGSIVEKVSGCNHMTCTCGEEFCYICGQHWRNCDCPQNGNYTVQDDQKEAVRKWFQFPQQPRCYGKEFLMNTCLPQTFFCAKCGHRCGKSGGASYQCQDCGRHVCESCVAQCLDGRYHNPDWNAEPADAAEYLDEETHNAKTSNEEPTFPRTTIQSEQEDTSISLMRRRASV